jgi:glycine betaine/proline transport system permease protein
MAGTSDTEAMNSKGTAEAPRPPDETITSRGSEAKSSGFLEEAPAPVRALISLPKWVWLVGALLLIGGIVPFGGSAEVPEDFQTGARISEWVNDAVDWMVVTGDPFFRAINVGLLRYLLLPLEDWLLSLPWWLAVVVVAIISYRIVGPIFSAVSVALMLLVAVLGIFDLAMSTLALVIVATLLSVILGVPAGILAARSDRFDAVLRPILDTMQTMPSFVYLIPVLMLFGLGKVPAILATVIYAVPPVIRLTNLGIRQVDSSVIEAARAFGSTNTQLLFKVQIPLAMPTIMAGLNQTIMMGLAMVVIAAIIGAKGLGVEVLNGIARLDVGRGLIGGIGIVVMAIILDRITQGFAKSRQRDPSPE